jgi:hypothetical protein
MIGKEICIKCLDIVATIFSDPFGKIFVRWMVCCGTVEVVMKVAGLPYLVGIAVVAVMTIWPRMRALCVENDKATHEETMDVWSVSSSD